MFSKLDLLNCISYGNEPNSCPQGLSVPVLDMTNSRSEPFVPTTMLVACSDTNVRMQLDAGCLQQTVQFDSEWQATVQPAA